MKRKNMRNNLEDILKLILTVLIVGTLIVLGTKLYIFLLPILIVVLIGYYIYIKFLKKKFNKNNKTSKKKKTIKNKIEEAEIIEEKFDK